MSMVRLDEWGGLAWRSIHWRDLGERLMRLGRAISGASPEGFEPSLLLRNLMILQWILRIYGCATNGQS